MNASNPFQIPSCFQRANSQLRRRNRVRKIVIGTVAFFVVLLVALLIAGCMSQHAKVANAAAPTATGQGGSLHVAQAKPLEPPPSTPPASSPAASMAPSPSASPVTTPLPSIYIVKPGDTLSQIAWQHHLSIKALKALNGLDSDTISIGMKLKLPTV